jgi:DNA replication and repair protein RecF
MKQRARMIKEFNKEIASSYDDIAGRKEKMQIKYHPSVEEDRFMDILAATQESEIAQGATTHGPHRDDFKLYLNGKDIATFGSRGEYRSAVLALKILELKYLASQKNEQPILLLDDIFSELDSERRMHLAKIVQDQQTIITTTDLDHIEESLRKKAKIVEIK